MAPMAAPDKGRPSVFMVAGLPGTPGLAAEACQPLQLGQRRFRAFLIGDGANQLIVLVHQKIEAV